MALPKKKSFGNQLHLIFKNFICILTFKEKKDKIKKTETRGKESRLIDVDNKVLDILDKDSASVCGMGINDPIEMNENVIPSCSKQNAENCAQIETTQNMTTLHKKVS